MNRKDLFACPFYFDRIELDVNRVNSAINSTQCRGAMSVDHDILRTNFNFLLNPIDNIVSDVMSELNFKNYNIFTSWMTKTVMGQVYGEPHSHCNSFMSGILYLTKNPSPIIFRHPLPWRWQSSLDDQNDGMLKSDKLILSPKMGDIVLFPSHVFHLIVPHNSHMVRCSLAFNVVPVGEYGVGDSALNVTLSPVRKV